MNRAAVQPLTAAQQNRHPQSGRFLQEGKKPIKKGGSKKPPKKS